MATGTIQNPYSPWDGIYIGSITTAKTLTFSSSASFLLVTNGSSLSRRGLYMVFSTSGGVVAVTNILEASAVTITTGSGQLSISASDTAYATVIPLNTTTASRITVT